MSTEPQQRAFPSCCGRSGPIAAPGIVEEGVGCSFIDMGFSIKAGLGFDDFDHRGEIIQIKAVFCS